MEQGRLLAPAAGPSNFGCWAAWRGECSTSWPGKQHPVSQQFCTIIPKPRLPSFQDGKDLHQLGLPRARPRTGSATLKRWSGVQGRLGALGRITEVLGRVLSRGNKPMHPGCFLSGRVAEDSSPRSLPLSLHPSLFDRPAFPCLLTERATTRRQPPASARLAT